MQRLTQNYSFSFIIHKPSVLIDEVQYAPELFAELDEVLEVFRRLDVDSKRRLEGYMKALIDMEHEN